MENYIVDAADRRWSIRRTCVDVPGRAYAARLLDNNDDVADILPGIIGFYAESIDDIRHKLGAN